MGFLRGITGLAKGLGAGLEAREGERRTQRELAYRTMLEKQLRGTPQALPPSQVALQEAQAGAITEQTDIARKQQDLAGKKARYEEWMDTVNKDTGGFKGGMESIGLIKQFQVYNDVAPSFKPGGDMFGKEGRTDEETAHFRAVEDWVADPTDRKKILEMAYTGAMLPKGKPEVGKEVFTRATTLRKEFNQAQVYKDFQTVTRSEAAMKQAYQMSIDPNIKSRIASDQALGVLFQKMLDPDSVVRESEYARTSEGAALVNRVRATLPRLQKGGLALANEDREALYEIAQKLLTEAKRTMNKHIERYELIAEDYRVPRELVFGNIQKFDISEDDTVDPLGIR